MKRKPKDGPKEEAAREAVLDSGREPVAPAAASEPEKKAKRPARCVVCASEVSPTSTEGLCWVCRRLKISAWRDTDSQMSAQE